MDDYRDLTTGSSIHYVIEKIMDSLDTLNASTGNPIVSSDKFTDEACEVIWDFVRDKYSIPDDLRMDFMWVLRSSIFLSCPQINVQSAIQKVISLKRERDTDDV